MKPIEIAFGAAAIIAGVVATLIETKKFSAEGSMRERIATLEAALDRAKERLDAIEGSLNTAWDNIADIKVTKKDKK